MRFLRHRTIDEFLAVASVCFLVFAAIFSVKAVKVIDARDTLSRLKVSTAANHDLVFITPSGAAEGSEIVIDFPGPFSAAGLTEDDVDLFDGGLPVTTAPDCSGSEQASVQWAGNRMRIGVCPGDGGAISPGSQMRIVVGTDAVGSGIGSNRIINPPAPGSYQLVISGAFGDFGEAPIGIVADDEVNVTACVGAECEAEPVVEPPAEFGGSAVPLFWIKDLAVSEISPSSFRLNWQTDVPSSSYVVFGTGDQYENIRGSDERVKNHSVNVLGLLPDTTYYFRARSVNVYGEAIYSETQSVTTKKQSPQGSSPPVIVEIKIISVSSTEAIVAWNTDKQTHYRLEYGRSTAYGAAIESEALFTSHNATIGGLLPDTEYHFRIIAIDAEGSQAISEDATFVTFDTIAPIVSSARAENIDARSVRIVWTTDEPAIGGVKFGRSTSYLSGEIIETTGYALDHSVALSDLLPGSTYHFKIFASDSFGNDGESADFIFKTAPRPSEPLPPEDVNPPVTTDNQRIKELPADKIIVLANGVKAFFDDGSFVVTPLTVITVVLPKEFYSPGILQATATIGANTYGFVSDENGLYTVSFAVSENPGAYSIDLSVVYSDKTVGFTKLAIIVIPPGTVKEEKDGKIEPIPGVDVTVYADGKVWDGSALGINNSQTTNENGEYDFYLPKGDYSLKFEKKGYKPVILESKEIFGSVNANIVMERVPLYKSVINFVKNVLFKLNIFKFNLLLILLLIVLFLAFFLLNKQKRS